MKKILLALLVCAFSSQLKAQQQTLKSFDPKLFTSPDNLLKPGQADTSAFQKYFSVPNTDKAALLATLSNKPICTELFYSRMPVLKTDRYNKSVLDKMSVINPADPKTRYNMPIKRIKVVDPFEKLEQLQQMNP